MKGYFSKLAGVLGVSALCSFNALALTVADNESHSLAPDNYYFDEVILGTNSTLVVKGETRIFTKSLQSKDGAKIEYEKGATRDVQEKWLRFEAMDASQMEGMLTFVGNGADGGIGATGGTGAKGRDAHWKNYRGAQSAHPGGSGGKGGTGQKGENGLNIEVNLLNLQPSAFVTIMSNGGNGGIGGQGGQGGEGGKGRYGRSPKDGGRGGNGGIGGNGGNGGDIWAFLLYNDTVTEQQLAELRLQLETNIIALPGQGGLAGVAGVGGTGGTPGGCSGLSCSRGQASPGAMGSVGVLGEPGQEASVLKDLKSASHVRPIPGTYTAFGDIHNNAEQPLERVSVKLDGRTDYAVTDEKGHWTISNIPNGEYTAIASKPQFEFEPQQFTVDGQDTEVFIKLKSAVPEDNYLDKCMTKFKDYFGNKEGDAFDCGQNNSFSCQMTTGGRLAPVTSIAIPKSQQGNFYYYWGDWGPLALSYCD
ncbi:carboxypeptidase regulatory-like domain-containing protein [Candidatus Venteria ishoeyi]|uniref:Collagen triple helix repeat (20 copies) n=1 Tax=Candidatus Venteria ishoeyi TaxID=1899563 RepID=A0A1H6F3R1_9GAMM|nr:carboxypeptidase regulatory-like domain-containing protein [Candidatus Venteria ishoeyi]SEH04760.1 Uncharacterised protein [Candidatus Venteria ishoeyi]